MRDEILRFFLCPSCRSALHLEQVQDREGDRIKEGRLVCSTGRHGFKVERFVPRFTSGNNYASSFGLEWNEHATTQLDSRNGMRISEERFFQETNWPRDLTGQLLLEVGSGSGRFTEIALRTGATVISMDYSSAVDANWSNNGGHPNLVLCQASLYELPFEPGTFDKVFCIGVLQHTPDVKRAFDCLAQLPRPGGELVVDMYNKDYWRNYHTPEYLIRPITKRIPPQKLYRYVSWAVPRLLPLSTWLRTRVPVIGHYLGALVPVSNYQLSLPTESQQLIVDYSILDTFDTLSPAYISPQRPSVARRWFADAGYEQIESDENTVFSMRGKRRASSSQK